MDEQRLIDANELITAFPCGETVRTECVRATIKHMPTIEEHKTGKWIQDPKSKRYRCDQCLSFALKTDDMQENLSDFCPVCGSYNGGKNEI